MRDGLLGRTGAGGAVYQGLIYNVIQQPRDHTDEGLAICFTSAHSGAGVTHVVRSLATEIGQYAPQQVARVDLSYLQSRALHAPDLSEGRDGKELRTSTELRGANPSAADTHARSMWHGSWQYRQDRINELRSQFGYVLIDGPSLKDSGEVLSVAPLVDGVILVVEADRTTAEQVLHAERQIEAAGGKCWGHILNKRKYVVPEWLYRRLSKS